MIKTAADMNRAKDEAWGRTGDCMPNVANNSFPGPVKHPSVPRGTIDEDGVAKRIGDGDFAELEHKLSHEKGVTDPAGLAAKIGMEKMGKAAFEEKAKEGREHKS